MTLIGKVIDRHEYVRFWKIFCRTTPRNAVGHHTETAGHALYSVITANQIDHLPFLERRRAHVITIQEHDTSSIVNSAIPIIEPVNRRVELIVTAHRHHEKFTWFQFGFR